MKKALKKAFASMLGILVSLQRILSHFMKMWAFASKRAMNFRFFCLPMQGRILCMKSTQKCIIALVRTNTLNF